MHLSGLHSKLRGRLLAPSDSRFSITMELHMCCYLYFTCAAIRVKRANFGLITTVQILPSYPKLRGSREITVSDRSTTRVLHVK
mmetsp:Transcript_24192/g.38110  ORF Transcript_24192/g.38110 Transcript_24192/m.38110 type:complete len:84 (+) Transcript_24192:122-373(+)